MHCPKCQTDHAHRSHRHGWFENLASKVGFFPYRCNQCDHRFLHRGFAVRSLRAAGDSEEEGVDLRRVKDRRRKRRDLLILATAAVVFLGFLYFLTREPPPPGGDGFATPPAEASPAEPVSG